MNSQFTPKQRFVGIEAWAAPLLFAVAVALFAASPVRAQVWNEVGDAGPLPGVAQTTAGIGALTTINGATFPNEDVDMYCILITDRNAFGACLNCLFIMQPDLYLFDASGKGVALAQICSAGCKQISNALVPGTGLYYIAVAPNGAQANSAGGAIWVAGQTSERAPDGAGAASAITSWGPGVLQGPANYSIRLSGATFCSAATPARPSTWGRVRNTYR